MFHVKFINIIPFLTECQSELFLILAYGRRHQAKIQYEHIKSLCKYLPHTWPKIQLKKNINGYLHGDLCWK